LLITVVSGFELFVDSHTDHIHMDGFEGIGLEFGEVLHGFDNIDE
jgi:hypothetical protein